MVTISKTVCQRMQDRPEICAWLTQTKLLYNRVVAFYFDVLQVHPGLLERSAAEALSALEQLTHATSGHPTPLFPLAALGQEIPAYFRRAAIHTALGAARTLATSYATWQTAKAKAAAQHKPFFRRPPVAPRQWNRSPVLYKGLWQGDHDHTVVLKLYDGQTWRWVRVGLRGRALPDGWEVASPALVCRGHHWAVHFPVTRMVEKPERARAQLAAGARVCAVDLNLAEHVAVSFPEVWLVGNLLQLFSPPARFLTGRPVCTILTSVWSRQDVLGRQAPCTLTTETVRGVPLAHRSQWVKSFELPRSLVGGLPFTGWP